MIFALNWIFKRQKRRVMPLQQSIFHFLIDTFQKANYKQNN